MTKTMSGRWLWIGVGLGAAAVISATTAIFVSRVRTSDSTPLGCASSPSAVLQADQLPDYVQSKDAPLRQLPFKGGIGGELPGYVTDFVEGRFRGFIQKIAYQEPYLSENRAQAASLNYSLGGDLLVPLAGTVVSDHRTTLLEIYESVYRFRGADDAATWLDNFKSSMAQDPSITADPGVSAPSGMLVYKAAMGADDGAHEHAYFVAGRLGTVILSLSFQGGVDLPLSTVRPLLVGAVSRIRDVCPQGVTGNS